LRVAVRAADEVDVLDDPIDDVCLIDAEALVFPEVAVDYALADRLLHYGGGVEAVGGKGARGAALVEEALFVCAVVGHVCATLLVSIVLQECLSV